METKTPTQAIERARAELVQALPDDRSATIINYVWQKSEEWGCFLHLPPGKLPYYRIEVTGQRVNGIPQFTSKVESFNRPDEVRATIWDRLLGPSDPPSD